MQNSFGAARSPRRLVGPARHQDAASAYGTSATIGNGHCPVAAGRRLGGKGLLPRLPEHPGHELIKCRLSGFGAVVSLRPIPERALRIMRNVRLWSVAVSLGGVESILSAFGPDVPRRTAQGGAGTAWYNRQFYPSVGGARGCGGSHGGFGGKPEMNSLTS